MASGAVRGHESASGYHGAMIEYYVRCAAGHENGPFQTTAGVPNVRLEFPCPELLVSGQKCPFIAKPIRTPAGRPM